MHVWVLSYFQLFATPWTLAMEFSRQGYWIELLFPNPRDLPNVGIKPVSPDCSSLCHLGSPVSKYAILMKTIAQWFIYSICA